MKTLCDGHEYTFVQDHKFQYRVLNNYGTVVAYVRKNESFEYWILEIPSPDNKGEFVFITQTHENYGDATESWLCNWAVTQYVAYAMQNETVESHNR